MRTATHPKLRKDPEFIKFLEDPNEVGVVILRTIVISYCTVTKSKGDISCQWSRVYASCEKCWRFYFQDDIQDVGERRGFVVIFKQVSFTCII